MSVYVIIPALDEEGAIGGVVDHLVKLLGEDGTTLVDQVIVVDNGSTDHTKTRALERGATVLTEPRRGYGRACLRGIAHIRAKQQPEVAPSDIVVFIDGDGSSDPSGLPDLLAPIRVGEADLVIGARQRRAQEGSMTLAQRFGTDLACRLMSVFHHTHYTDLGPFRAIRWVSLNRLEMQDPTYGWTVEMQIKAIKANLRVCEVDVVYRPRVAGRSKVSGTVRGVVGAGVKIVGTVFRHR